MEIKKCAICGKETIYEMGGVPLCYHCIVELENESTDEISDIIRRVCRITKLSIADFQKRSRKREIVVPRQLAMYFAKRMNKWNTTTICREMGSLDHSNIYNSVKAINNYIDTDKNFREKYKSLFEYYG